MFSKSRRSSNSASSSTKPAFIDHAGINNLGNSCYLNSIVQSLGASRALRDALAGYPGAEVALKAAKEGAHGEEALSTSHQEESNVPLGTPTAETSPTLQLLTQENAHPAELPLSSALASTLVKLWSGKQSTISVKSLMKALNRKNEDWNEFDQMDAHELLRFLLDGVSMEEFDLIKKLQPPPLAKPKSTKKARNGPRPVAEQLRRKAAGTATSSSEESDSSDDLSTSEAESLLAEDPTYRLPAHPPPPKRFTPFIDTIFGGKLASVIVCEECRGVNRIEEDFLDISLPLKSDDSKVRRRDRLRKFLSSSSSNLSQEQKEANSRPKLAPRAPTAILSVSETEASEPEEGGKRAHRISSNLSGASGAETGDAASNTDEVDERGEKVKRRRSLDPGLLRASSTKRNFLNPMSSSSAKSRDPSLLSRGKSTRTTPATSEADTTGSDLSGLTGASRKPRSQSAGLLSKPTREQQDYIRKLFAEIPGPSPLAGLRIAQPGGMPTTAESNGSSSAYADAATTGLYTCLMQFTSVEALEGDNAFQCRRCWKLLNPGVAAQVGRKRASRLAERTARTQDQDHRNTTLAKLRQSSTADGEDGTPRARNHVSADYMQQHTTPRGSVSAGNKDESMVLVNRRLLAEKDRQRSLESGTAGDSSVSGMGPTSSGPDIRVIANSPPATPVDAPVQGNASQQYESSAAQSDEADAGVSGFSQLTVTASRGSRSDGSQSDSAVSPIDDVSSDLGAEADAEGDQSESEGPQALTSRSSVNASTVSFAQPDRQSGVPLAAESVKIPALPPRAQRYISRKAHKRYLISSLPAILVLHLKRFQQTSKSSMFGNFNNLKKLDDKVTFPLYLDMAPFMAPPPLQRHSSSETSADGHNAPHHEARGRTADKDETRKERHHWFRRASPSAEARSNCQYRLYAVIVHQGNMGSGHYIAYVLTSQRHVEGQTVTGGEQESEEITKSDNEAPRQWLYCSDHIVKAASQEEVLRSQAYCLLYERIQPRQSPKL